MEIKNALIESVSLTRESHGMLIGWLHLDYGGSGQGFGGQVLFQPYLAKKDDFDVHTGGAYAGWFIQRCLEIGDVMEWNELVGKSIRVKCEHSQVHAIGHILEDDWFSPSDDWKKED